MAGRPWYPHYLDDYARDTAHLSMLQHGAYRLLLDHYYATQHPLPALAEQLHRICRATTPEETAAVDFVVAEFFRLRRGKYHHKRCDSELVKADDISKKRGNAAKSRHAKAPAKAPAIAEHLKTHPHPHPTKKEESKKVLSNGIQVGNGHSVTIEDPNERIARFQQAIATKIGAEGWGIIAAATNREHPEHKQSLAVCKRVASDLGKGWPHRWPIS